jgi:glycosyltransferase involved in cell wall biosynthesis
MRQEAFCFSQLHADRLEREGVNGRVTVLRGQYEGTTQRPEPVDAQPAVVYAGRHIPEKRVTAVVPAVLQARKTLPGLRAAIYGDGPDRPAVLEQVKAFGLGDDVDVPGFVAQETVERALAESICLVLPSRREGYGLVVVEALARGTPAVVVNDPDNAAVELIEERVNGFVAASASPRDLADAIVRVHAAGTELRRSTADWFARNAASLSLDASLETVSNAYASR